MVGRFCTYRRGKNEQAIHASITADAPIYANAIKAEFPSHNDRGRIFARAVVVQALLLKIDATADWKIRFKQLIATLPATVMAKAGLNTSELGLVIGWEQRQFWS
ncbi:hypothetical protein AL050_03760 [Pseudomonas syringae pv. daphniphylli]|uniref:Uncharacterized protein n=1 Tax=Pseudomonas syringae pv. actinidiae TaxID=103796 RepID=A0A650D7Y8_PSESF|nr:hypothetical protein CN228_08515 [Pseudomonas syringae pv. actinidiae str. Shaanxi_M228]KPY57568.1 hypothetical protein ALO93_200154 [Pseudomonas amygdali pv. sesami]KWS44588.1 hypothetical protein AL057_10180 [Pseudomonas amygdali pv. myricae]KWS83033.1 hypothetical protein AL050_03760 [Pseudomonas syringae pv. daphniphylli]QGR26507.1 hypothetical protein [Pseudomonas syringae pv. actinidiae]